MRKHRNPLEFYHSEQVPEWKEQWSRVLLVSVLAIFALLGIVLLTP